MTNNATESIKTPHRETINSDKLRFIDSDKYFKCAYKRYGKQVNAPTRRCENHPWIEDIMVHIYGYRIHIFVTSRYRLCFLFVFVKVGSSYSGSSICLRCLSSIYIAPVQHLLVTKQPTTRCFMEQTMLIVRCYVVVFYGHKTSRTYVKSLVRH